MFEKYENIINPMTNRKVSIHSKKGMNIVKNYLNELYGGASQLPEELDPNRFGPQVRPVALQGFKGYQDIQREERMKQVNAAMRERKRAEARPLSQGQRTFPVQGRAPIKRPFGVKHIPPFHPRPARPRPPSRANTIPQRQPPKNVIDWIERIGLSTDKCRVSRKARCVLARTEMGKKSAQLRYPDDCKFLEDRDSNKQICRANTLYNHLEEYQRNNEVDSDKVPPRWALAQIQATARPIVNPRSRASEVSRASAPVQVCKECKMHQLHCKCPDPDDL